MWENFCSKVFWKIELKNWVEELGGMVWNNRIDNCMEKFDDQFQYEIFLEQIGCKIC